MASLFFSDGTVPLYTLRDNIALAIQEINNPWHKGEMKLILRQIDSAIAQQKDCTFKL